MPAWPRQGWASIASLISLRVVAMQDTFSIKHNAYPNQASASHRELESIATTKLKPPRSARKLVARTGLLNRLIDARRKRCLLVRGPAGSGKTSALVDYRKMLAALDFDVAWLTLSPEDNDPQRFCDCLLASLAEVNPAMVQKSAAALIHRGEYVQWESWALTLALDMQEHLAQRDLVLVIDDLHWTDAPEIGRLLQALLEYAPERMHFALGSRTVPPVALARLRSQNQIEEFEMRDLRFTAAESAQFLKEHIQGINDKDIATLHELTEGWVAGLQLFAVDLKAKDGQGFSPIKLRDAQSFAQYFEQEVLHHLPAQDMDLLTRLSICNRFSASLVASLLGTPRALARTIHRLNLLESSDLFLTPVEGAHSETWYRLHPLLREVLQLRLQKLPIEEVNTLHTLAWQWFEEHGHIDEAVRHAVDAGQPASAAAMVDACSVELMARGDFPRINNLMRRLPHEVIEQHFRLEILRGYILLYTHQLDTAKVHTQALARKYTTLNLQQRRVLVSLQAGIASLRDDTAALQELEAELLAFPNDAEDAVLATRRNALGWLYMQQFDFAKARRLLTAEEAYGASRRSDLLSRNLLGMSYLLEGDLSTAEQIFRAALNEADRFGAALDGPAFMAAGLLAEVQLEINQPQAVIALLEPRLRSLEFTAIPDTVLRVLVSLATAQRQLGRKMEAWALIEQLEDYASRWQLSRLSAHALQISTRWHVYDKNTQCAAACLARLEALTGTDRQSEANSRPNVEIQLSLALAQALVFQAKSNSEHALEALHSALSLCQSSGRQRTVPHLHLQLANVLYQTQRCKEALPHLLEALQLGQRHGLVLSLLDAFGNVRPLLEHALTLPQIQNNLVVSHYVQRLVLLQASHAAPRSPESVSSKSRINLDTLSEREREVMDLLGQAMPNKKIARTLGVSPETVKWHLKNVYNKLGVSERDAAVARWRDATLMVA